MSKQHAPYTGSLYQLHSARQLSAGAYVEVNGPHDRYGIVQNSKQEADGRYLNLIRGTKPRITDTPVARF